MPRQSETLAKLSRQALRADLRISQRPNMPANTTSSQSPERKVATSDSSRSAPEPSASAATEAQKQRADTAAMATTDEQISSLRQVEVLKLSRSETEPSEAQVASLPTLQRRMERRPRKLPSTATPVDESLSQSQRVEESLEANSTLVTKRTTTSPEQTARVDLQPKVATNLDRSSRVDQPETDTISQSLARSTLAKPSKVDTEVEAPQPTEEAATRSNELFASATKVAQQQAAAPRKSATNAPADSPNESLQPSSQAVARATAETEPSLAKKLASAKSLTRAQVASKKTASPRAAVSSSIEAAFDSENPSPATEPSRMALSRSTIGMAGVGAASNLERGVAAPETPVNIASASANRMRATQAMDPGPAFSPSVPSPNRQLRASADTPRTSMQAQPIDTAMVPGAVAPAAAAASSSAALQRAASNAASGPVTAAKGSTEVDLGTPRIAADLGNGRAEGGGQPEITTGEQPRALQRENLVAGKSGVNTSTEAPVAGAPLAQDVAAEQSASANATGTEVAKSFAAENAGGAPSVGELTSAEAGDIRIARATGERADANITDSAPSIAAGGTSSPGRTTRSLAIRTTTQSDTPTLAGADTSAGSRRGDPLDAQGAKPSRSAAGILTTDEGQIGAAAADQMVDGVPEGLTSPTFSRSSKSGSFGKQFDLSKTTSGTPRRSRRVAIAGSGTEVGTRSGRVRSQRTGKFGPTRFIGTWRFDWADRGGRGQSCSRWCIDG